jgi:hypothetical protein
MQLTAASPAPQTESTRRCTGPRTREGKQKSSQNSTKHGCCSKRLLLPEEDPDEWEALKAGWLQSYDTSDPVSLTLVLTAAEAQWQQIRAQNAFSAAQHAIYEETRLHALDRRTPSALLQISTLSQRRRTLFPARLP